MKARDPRPNQLKPAPVIAIEQYRRDREYRSPESTQLDSRIQRVRDKVTEHLNQQSAPALGVAMVVLRGDGKLLSIAEAIEPEQAALFAEELERLARRLRNFDPKPHAPPHQGGRVLLATAVSLAFMAATYLNQNALIDAALSLVAQLAASALSKGRR